MKTLYFIIAGIKQLYQNFINVPGGDDIDFESFGGKPTFEFNTSERGKPLAPISIERFKRSTSPHSHII